MKIKNDPFYTGKLFHGNDKTFEIDCQGSDILKYVEIDEGIRDRMSAIDIAARLLNKDPSTGFMYVIRKTDLKWNWSYTKELQLLDVNGRGAYNFTAIAPTFIWSIVRGGVTIDHFILSCKEDLTVKFPIRRVSIELWKQGRVLIDKKDLNLEECIELLDATLENL